MVDINDNGDLLVVMVLTGGKGPYKSFIYRNGNYKELLPPGFEDFHGYAINNKGEVIGTTFNGKSFIYTNGKFIELTLGSWYLEPRGINDYGVITGYLWMPNGVRRGFIAYPVPQN
jgi:hypothetical protein